LFQLNLGQTEHTKHFVVAEKILSETIIAVMISYFNEYHTEYDTMMKLEIEILGMTVLSYILASIF